MNVSLTGNDSTVILDRIFNDFTDGDVVVLEFPNNLVEAKTGKNGNIIYAYNSTGKVVNVTIRILKGSADDKFLNNQLNIYIQNPPAYVLMEAEFTKRIGDGTGNVTNEIYKLSGGIIQKYPGAKENVEGDTESAVTIYNIVFGNNERLLA
jgi:hypothetical protein